MYDKVHNLHKKAFLDMYWDQGCQMVYFRTENTNLGKFWRALGWKMLVYFMAIWYILWSFGIFYNVVLKLYINHRFGILCQEKSGNSDWER
jgi:hypothetical protein